MLESLDSLSRQHEHISKDDKDVFGSRLKRAEVARTKMVNIYLNISFLQRARDLESEYFQNPHVNVKDLETEASAQMLRFERNRERLHEESLRKYSLLVSKEQLTAKAQEVSFELEKCQKRLALHSGIVSALNAELGLEDKQEQAMSLILDITRGNSASKVQFLKNSIE